VLGHGIAPDCDALVSICGDDVWFTGKGQGGRIGAGVLFGLSHLRTFKEIGTLLWVSMTGHRRAMQTFEIVVRRC